MTAANDWTADAVLEAAARKLLISIDCDTGAEPIDVTTQLLARFLSRRLLGPMAKQFGAIDMFTQAYNQDNEHIREKIDYFVNLIALAMNDPIPDSLDDPRAVKALATVRDLTEKELDKIVADPGADILSALRNDFGRQPDSSAVAAVGASSGGCLIAMVSLAVSASSLVAVVRRRVR